MKCTKNSGQTANIWLDGDKLTRTKAFSYLGSLISSDGKSQRDVIARIAKNAFLKKKSRLASNAMSIHAKILFMKSFIWSVGTYASETWTLVIRKWGTKCTVVSFLLLTLKKLIKQNYKLLRCGALRRMVRISWTARVSNERVLNMIGVKPSLLKSIEGEGLE